MLSKKDILTLIKTQVLSVLPDASVLLFGSRVTGNVHAESDWDILILTERHYAKSAKWAIHDKLFTISVTSKAFINILLVQKEEWITNARYYCLRESAGANMMAI